MHVVWGSSVSFFFCLCRTLSVSGSPLFASNFDSLNERDCLSLLWQIHLRKKIQEKERAMFMCGFSNGTDARVLRLSKA